MTFVGQLSKLLSIIILLQGCLAQAFLDTKSGKTEDPGSSLSGRFLKPSKEYPFSNSLNKNPDPGVTVYESHYVHWDSLKDLNTLAQEITSEIKSCYGESIKNFRIDYYRTVLPCGLKDRVIQLHQQLYNFLLTTDVHAFNEDVSYNLKLIAKIINPNSLLNQAIIEMLAAVTKFDQNEMITGAIMPGKFWIDYPYNINFNYRVSKLLSDQNNVKIDTEKYRLARIYKNTRLLASILIGNSSCDNWGLWPETGYAFSQFVAWQTNRRWGDTRMYEFENLTCSPSGDVFDFYNLFNQNAFKTPGLITEIRGLAQKYGYETNRRFICHVSNWLSFMANQKDLKWEGCFSVDPENVEDDLKFYRTHRQY